MFRGGRVEFRTVPDMVKSVTGEYKVGTDETGATY